MWNLNYNPDREAYISECLKKGLTVLEPKEDELFIDIDDNESKEIFERRWPAIADALGMSILYRYPSRNKDEKTMFIGEHIIIRTGQAMSDEMRIAFQALLGSDWIRERISLSRIILGIPKPTLLVEGDNINGFEELRSRGPINKQFGDSNIF